MSTQKVSIKSIRYGKETQRVGTKGSYVDCIENFVTMTDGSELIRLGICKVAGENIKEMALSLNQAIAKKGDSIWFSLQTTNLLELKASYRVGFRSHNGLSGLEAHIKEFQKQGSTLYMDRCTSI